MKPKELSIGQIVNKIIYSKRFEVQSKGFSELIIYQNLDEIKNEKNPYKSGLMAYSFITDKQESFNTLKEILGEPAFYKKPIGKNKNYVFMLGYNYSDKKSIPTFPEKNMIVVYHADFLINQEYLKFKELLKTN
jgi:hypothetical protein